MGERKRVVITYGTYDLLHYGHVALLERAKKLGDYLIVGVTSDAFDKERGKLNVHQSLPERLRAVEELGLADKVIVEEYKGQKIADIVKYGVDVFTVGSDWEGKFDYLRKYCDVVYLDRTQGVSSTELRAERSAKLRLGCIGLNYLAHRLAKDSKSVGGIDVTCGFDEDDELAAVFCRSHGLELCETRDELFQSCDAVYIAQSIDKHKELILSALGKGRHVLCESPLFLSPEDADEAFRLAENKGVVLMEGVKTKYYPAFSHLKLMLESGIVGEVKDIDASFSQVIPDLDVTNKYQGSFYDMASYILLPVLEFVGTDFSDARLIASYRGDFCAWTKCELLYPTASATVRAGRGMKTEGDMTITGEDGYVYVPAPWWKTEYFEVRSEDLRDTRKYYYECCGEGMRYELHEFVRRIGSGEDCLASQLEEVERVRAVSRLVERFSSNDVVRLSTGRFCFGGGEAVKE
ncbi:Gfo/Idh/MocA family oxidoreductase [Arabiibacter massiliensis]|uniref:Gfo/Idh/MocA family oxidoreductase n=1 Tax=Arabiibacter massiliensis TaxID=1870985 RepID=UPI0009BB0C28|nr:Gfo/Idh/MocA family oxidoreductase [Arabiibacter massiliensis]